MKVEPSRSASRYKFGAMNYWTIGYFDNEADKHMCRKAVVVSMWRVMVTQWHNDDTRVAHEDMLGRLLVLPKFGK